MKPKTIQIGQIKWRDARAASVLLCVLVCSGLGSGAYADVEPSLRKEKQLQGIEIEDRLGVQIDTAMRFVRHDGEVLPLAEYFDETKSELPVIVTIGYYECPMLCSLVLNALVDSLKKSSLKLGEDYRVLSFSVDTEESADMAASKRKNYLSALGAQGDGWDFFVSPDNNIAQLAQSLGFGYRYDEYHDEYAHGAGIFIVTPKGVLSRTIWGIAYDPFQVKLALVEASAGKVGSVVDKIILSCFHYVPDSHKYGIYVFGTMRLGATLTVVILGTMLAAVWIRERRRNRAV